MLMQCLFAVCILAIVIVGLLVMTQLISLEELGNGIWRAFLTVLVSLIAICFLKAVLLPILICWIVRLKQMFLWIAVVVLALVIALLVLRMLISKLAQRSPAKGERHRGEL